MIAVNSGLGFLIVDARNAGNRYDLVVAGMVMIGVIGLLLDIGMRSLENLKSLSLGLLGGCDISRIGHDTVCNKSSCASTSTWCSSATAKIRRSGRHQPGGRRRRVSLPGRPVRLRQIDAAEHDGRISCLPLAGEVTIDGEAVSGPDPRRIFVFQERGVFPWLTVEGNIEFGLFKLRQRGTRSSASPITSKWLASRALKTPTRRNFRAA